MKKLVIIGGGPAGLTAAIHLAREGMAVSLFEKEAYPRHKVCGEYLSGEVLPYLEQLGVAVSGLNAPVIKRLGYSNARGRTLTSNLGLGGLGTSRYGLDYLLYLTALESGVNIIAEEVREVNYCGDHFRVRTSHSEYLAEQVVGAYGKRGVLDKKMHREFFGHRSQWMAIKSHYIQDHFPSDLVELHSFRGGYCGLSRTEMGTVNLCLLVGTGNFSTYRDYDTFRDQVLRKSPKLDRFLSQAHEVFTRPLSIAQVSFRRKALVEDHVLMIGDAAGLIHPLCGNGMAMGIRSAQILSETILEYLRTGSDRMLMEKLYKMRWHREFQSRLRAGRWLQKILLKESLSGISQTLLTGMPFLLKGIIRQTHGSPQA